MTRPRHDGHVIRRTAAAATTALIAAAAVALTSLPAPSAAPAPTRWVSQAGTYDYLLTPDYTGVLPLSEVVGRSTIGLGTFDHLDGELVLVGGTVYRVGTDGIPAPADLATTTPFFQGVAFAPQTAMRIPEGTACSAMTPIIDELAGTTDGVVAVRITGAFAELSARSVPRQEQPYPPLADVVADQTVFPLADVRATLVGFRTGNSAKGIGAPGLHLHGLTADKSAGGHILSCTTGPQARMYVQVTRGVRVHTG